MSTVNEKYLAATRLPDAKIGQAPVRLRIRQVALALTAVLPGPLKKAIYRWCFGYRIGQRVRLGLAYLDCHDLAIGDDAVIGHGVLFVRTGQVRIGHHAIVGSLNVFRGGVAIDLGDYSQVIRLNVINAIPNTDCADAPNPCFELGYGAVLTCGHRVDFTDQVRIGRCSILGGRNSSIWTHNRRRNRPVTVGDYCCLGSEIRIAPGTSIPDCSVVGIGSLLSGTLVERYTFLTGAPARPVRALTMQDADMIFGATRPDLPDQDYPWSGLEEPALSTPAPVPALAGVGSRDDD